MTLGTAGVLLGALWARRAGADATALATRAADVLLAEAEPAAPGTRWRLVSRRFLADPGETREMSHWSHGVGGIAAALALAGRELGRADLVSAAVDGAQHLVSLAVTARQPCHQAARPA